MKKRKAIILAAGQGTRLRPLTNDTPKCMVEVNGKPLLERQLDVLTTAGIDEIIVVAGYRNDKINDSRISKVINEEYANTNMIYSLFCAEEYLEGEIVIAYGDIFYTRETLETLLNSDGEIVIASDENWEEYWRLRFDDPLSDAETFIKDTDSKVKSLGKKPSSTQEVNGQFIGLIKLTDEGVKKVINEYKLCLNDAECKSNAWGSGRDLRNAYMTDLMNYFAQKGLLHYASISRGWFEIDDLKDLEIANSKSL